MEASGGLLNDTFSTTTFSSAALFHTCSSAASTNSTNSASFLSSPLFSISFHFWGTQIETPDMGLVLGPIIVYWVFATYLFIIETLDLKILESYKINPPSRPPNRVSVPHVISRVLLQHLIQMTVAFLFVWLAPRDLERQMEDVGTILIKMVVGAFMLDAYQYWMHRLFHRNKFLYKHFHSIHHEVTAPYAYGALYNHPVEGLCMDTIGGGLPVLLLDMHPWTATLFACIATMKTVNDHCGYMFPWDPLHLVFHNNAAYHDVHHWGKGIKYNFSQPFFTIWDDLGGTLYPYSVSETVSEKYEDDWKRKEKQA